MYIARYILAAFLALFPSIAQAGQWGVHLASYKLKANVHSGWSQLQTDYPELLDGLSPLHVMTNVPGKGVFIRLIAGPIPNRNSADALRREFVARGKYADVLALPDTDPPSTARPRSIENIPLCSTMHDLQVRIRPVDTHDLIGMDANPVLVVVARSNDSKPPRNLASRAYTPATDPQNRSKSSLAAKLKRQLPHPATVSLHSDILTKNTSTGAMSDPSPGGERERHEFAGMTIGNGQVNFMPGLCRIGDDVGPYAGIGISF